MPVRPDAVLSDPERETIRKLFFLGPQQIEDLPSREAVLLLSVDHAWVDMVRGWYFLTSNGIGACLSRGYGREKERTTKPA